MNKLRRRSTTTSLNKHIILEYESTTWTLCLYIGCLTQNVGRPPFLCNLIFTNFVFKHFNLFRPLPLFLKPMQASFKRGANYYDLLCDNCDPLCDCCDPLWDTMAEAIGRLSEYNSHHSLCFYVTSTDILLTCNQCKWCVICTYLHS